ncbi:hypothetical protein [Dyadobacter sp. OTU695]|uniref:hypothetical protein n=1 Tax=Dyadobacter sp. OTU695 TaxID=3043860 RepID=UPI00313BA029
MERDYGHDGPHIVQVRRVDKDSLDYWLNVKGYDEENDELIMADPEDKLTMEQALEILRKISPTGFSAIYRVVRWENSHRI